MNSAQLIPEFLYIGGDFTEIDGFSANSIVAWDGTSWHALGNGVTGEIFDIFVTTGDSRVYIVGDFYLNDNPDIINAAYWSNGEWYPITNQQIEGVFYTIHVQTAVYVGGEFKIVTDSDTIKNLAYKAYSDNHFSNADGAFSVNGIVKDFLWYDVFYDNLLVAGDFTETGVLTQDTSINHLEADGLAYWNRGNIQDSIPPNWDFGFNLDLTNISSIAHSNGWLAAGSDSISPNSGDQNIALLSAGIWDHDYYRGQHNFLEPARVMGFVEYDKELFAYGNILAFGGLSTGLIPIRWLGSKDDVTAKINDVVRAAETFDGHLYVAGDFTEIFDEEFNGLAYTAFEPLAPEIEVVELDTNIIVYAKASEIHVQHEVLKEDMNFMVYNLNGQLISETTLHSDVTASSISTQSWATGMHVYLLVGNGIRQNGKLLIY